MPARPASEKVRFHTLNRQTGNRIQSRFVERFIDLYSDTKSLPTDGMRRFMMAAELGDEQKDEDRNVLELNARVADLLDKEAAVWRRTTPMTSSPACRLPDAAA